MAVPTTIAPTQEREVYIVKEATPGVIPASVGSVMPVLTMKPSDKPMLLDDESFQGSMGDIYGEYQGPLIAGLDTGGNFFGDHGLPELLYNLLGDYTVSGTAASPAGVSSAPIAAGATSITVASGGASFTNGMQLWIEDAGSPAANEVVTVTSGSTGTNIPLVGATRFAHLTATPFTNTSAPYTHVFSLLNGSVGAANGPAQGPTHALTDRTGLPATDFARQYAYCCVSEITITGNAEQLLKWTAKIVCQTGVIASAPVAAINPSGVQAYPSWRSVVGVGGPASAGTLVNDTAEWAVTLTRALKAYNTNQGVQMPYIIARGKQGVTGQLTFSPAISEAPLIALLANTQPQLQFVASNGLGGASVVSLQSDILLGSYQTSDINDGSELFGYDVPFKAIHTNASAAGVTMTGASGGKGAIKLTIVNGVASY
jgi:Phage tail tube protein